MNIVPIRDYVVVEKPSDETRTASGIVMVNHVSNVISAIVLSVGSGRIADNGTIIPPEVHPGDKVSFNVNFATEMSVDDKKYLLLKEENIMCVIQA